MKKDLFHREKNVSAIAAILVIALIVIASLCTTAVVMNGNVTNKNLNEGTSENITETPTVGQDQQQEEQTTTQTGTVTVHYVDEEGNELTSEPTVKTGTVGQVYEVERVEIPRYTRAGEDPINKAGYYEVGNKDVYFVYKTAGKQVKVGVKNEGEDGAEKSEVNVVFNNTKAYVDYAVKLIAKDQNGNRISGGTFQISKASNVLVSSDLRNGEVYFGKISVGTEGNLVYGIEQTAVASGYSKIDGEIGLTLNSVWDTEANRYKLTSASTDKEGTSATVNEQDKEVIVEVINEKIADMYEMEIVYRSESEVVNGATVKVEKDSDVIKEEKITSGKMEIKNLAITETGTDSYYISEVSGVEGYESALKDGKRALINVVKSFNGSYSISANSNTSGVATEVVGNKLYIYIDITKVEKVEKYDLAIMKFVSEIDGRETSDREPIVHVNKDGKKFSYSKKNDIEQAANNQKITYRLRMYNESEEEGKGKRIIEDIPAGLVYIPEDTINNKYDWKGYTRDKDGDLVAVSDISKATVLVTDYLEGKVINGYNKANVESAMSGNAEGSAFKYLDFEDVEVVFQVDETKVNNENRIIENVVTIQKNTNDDNRDNDTTSEKVYVKYFDLSIMKYIEEVKVKNNLEDRTINVGESKKGQTVKIDVVKSQVKNTTITVTYGLKITNVGQIEGYASKIVDYIPDDFKLINDGTWTQEGNQAITTKLEDTILEPGESTILNLTFEWKLTEDNIGLRVNEGKIAEYENPYDAIDITNDNNDKESMLVSVKTGGIKIAIAVAIIIISTMGVLVIVKKKNSMN